MGRLTAEYAFQQVADKFIHGLSTIDDEYLRERAADMRDVTSRSIIQGMLNSVPVPGATVGARTINIS